MKPALLVALSACAAIACSPTPTGPEELCDSADSLIGTTLVVGNVYDRLTVLDHAAVACEAGACCNPATVAPTIRCGDGPDILLVPGDDLEPFHQQELECYATIDNAPLVDGTAPDEACLVATPCGNWDTARATLSDDTRTDPISGEPLRLLRVHELLSFPTR